MRAHHTVESHRMRSGVAIVILALVGFIYERRHTRKIADFGGLAHVMPVYTAFFIFMSLASIGLPGLSGFVVKPPAGGLQLMTKVDREGARRRATFQKPASS